MQLIEHYLSIQGEGLHAGHPAYFVRFARCNLRCRWCDSTYTFGEGKSAPFSKVAAAIRRSGAHYVCLTGGEPLLHAQDCLRLIRKFPKLEFDIETGGALDIRPFRLPNVHIIMDWKLAQSGMSGMMLEENLRLLQAEEEDLLKFVSDGSSVERKEMETLLKRTERMRFPASIQPVEGTPPQALAEWMIGLRNPRLQFNLQLHKAIWPGVRSGV